MDTDNVKKNLSLTCNACNKTYSTIKKLLKHLKRVHIDQGSSGESQPDTSADTDPIQKQKKKRAQKSDLLADESAGVSTSKKKKKKKKKKKTKKKKKSRKLDTSDEELEQQNSDTGSITIPHVAGGNPGGNALPAVGGDEGLSASESSNRYRCQHCAILFTSIRVKKNHETACVSNQGRFRCVVAGCPFRSPYRYSVTRHNQQMHGNNSDKVLPCKYCGMTFIRADIARKHIASCLKNPHRTRKCGCGLVCNSFHELVAHKKICASNVCTICSRHFTKNTLLRLHLRECKLVNSQCRHCARWVSRGGIDKHERVCAHQPSTSYYPEASVVVRDTLLPSIGSKTNRAIASTQGAPLPTPVSVSIPKAPQLIALENANVTQGPSKRPPRVLDSNDILRALQFQSQFVRPLPGSVGSNGPPTREFVGPPRPPTPPNAALLSSLSPASSSHNPTGGDPTTSLSTESSHTPMVCDIDRVVFPTRYNLERTSPPIIPVFDIHPNLQKQIDRIYWENWLGICSHIRHGPRTSTYNLRFGEGGFSMATIKKFLYAHLYTEQKYCMKLNISPGCCLFRGEEFHSNGEITMPSGGGNIYYFYPSSYNSAYYDKNKTVYNRADFVRFVEALDDVDFLHFCRTARPDTKYQILFVTQLEVKVTRLAPHTLGLKRPVKIGAPVTLPLFIAKRRCIHHLTHDNNRVPYTDHLCLFRSLSLALGNDIVHTDVYAVQYFHEYYGENSSVYKYKGFKLADLHLFERKFKIRVNVFVLTREKVGGGRMETVGRVQRESAQIYKPLMNCSLYENHFSYIKSVNVYCKAYPCAVCAKIFRRVNGLKQHIKTECGNVKHQFPGGVYSSRVDIFTLLLAEGIVVDEKVPRYFEHWMCWDMESFQIPTTSDIAIALPNLPLSTTSMKYTAYHGIMSSSVISNVEGYTEPRGFIVSDTLDGHGVVLSTLHYMLEISDSSYRYFCYVLFRVYSFLSIPR